MPKLTFVIGPNCAGKSWYIHQKFDKQDIDILDVYDYQQRAYDEAGFGKHIPFRGQYRCLMRANTLLLADILERLTAERDVVVEQTFYKAKRRIAYIDEIRRKIPNIIIVVYVMCPSDALWQSNLAKQKLEVRFQSCKAERNAIEFPNVAEGFDAIYEVVDGEERLRMEPPRYEILAQARKELTEEAEKIRLEDEAKKKRIDLLESMNVRKFWHYCEVCGAKEFISAQEAFDKGWDYPPNIGHFGMLSPRTCGNCLIKDTLFWKINTSGKLPIVCEGDLTPEELVTWRRIKGEPESLLYAEE